MVVSKTPNSYKNGRKWGCIGCSIQVCEGRLYREYKFDDFCTEGQNFVVFM